MRTQDVERRLAARRLRERSAGRIEDPRRRHLLAVEVLRCKLPVRRRRTTVEGDREAVRRPDLAERRRRQPVRIGREEADVHALFGEPPAYEVTVAVGADARDDRSAHAETRETRGHIAGEAADEARKALHLRERRLELVRVEIDPHPAEHRSLDHR
jgi:hypothetical protein